MWLLAGPIKWNRHDVTIWSVFQNRVTVDNCICDNVVTAITDAEITTNHAIAIMFLAMTTTYTAKAIKCVTVSMVAAIA